MKKLIFLIISFLIFYSCTSHKIIQGIYFDRWFDTYHSLTLNPDSTFTFIIKEGLQKDSISGTWRIAKNKLILNSYITTKDTRSFHQNMKCDTCIVGIHIKVIDFETRYELQYAHLNAFIKGKIIQDETANQMGNVLFIDEKIDSIRVAFVGFNSYTLIPDKNDNNLYYVNMKLEELNRKVIENEIWKINKNLIVSPEGFKLLKVSESSNK